MPRSLKTLTSQSWNKKPSGRFFLGNNSIWSSLFSSLTGWTQEPNLNRKPEPSEPFFSKPKAEPEPPEPFSRNRNRNRNRPFLLNSTEIHKKTSTFLQRNRRNRNPEPLESFHTQTVTEPNRTGAFTALSDSSILDCDPETLNSWSSGP